MNWFFIALLAPFFWSISNHVDKFLLSRHQKGIAKEALILYSTLFGLAVLPLAYFIDKNIFSIGPLGVTVLILAGCLNSITIYLYLFALEDEEVSIVAPLWQTIPIFGLILGFLLLKESLSFHKIIGALIIMLGAMILSLEFNEQNRLKVKTKVGILMLGSSFSFAAYETLFKLVAIENSFWISVFWEYIGLIVFGLILFLWSKKHRNDFLFLMKKQNWKFFSINVANESLTTIGNIFSNFALLLAPVALVMAISGYQPIFVFLGGIILTIFFPRIAKENISKKHLLHRALAILVVFLGTIIIYN